MAPTPHATKTVEKWAWILIYGGLLTLLVGWSVQGLDDRLAAVLLVAGAVAAVVGFLLIWVRSRMTEPPRADKETSR